MRVKSEFTISLDGFIAGPEDEVGPLFGWYRAGDTDFPVAGTSMTFKVSRASAELLTREWSAIGAIVTGRRDFDVSKAWGGQPVLGVPHFIVTHQPPPEWSGPGSPFIFVTDGVESAVAQARRAAGERNVGVGGTTIVRQCLKAGLLDEIQLNLAPVLLGKGIRLFDDAAGPLVNLEILEVVAGMGVTHLRYRVIK